MTDIAAAGSMVLTPDEMRAAEARSLTPERSSFGLMQAAARAVARAAMAEVEPGARILVLCGPGKNGGDGYAAARILLDEGYDVGVAASVAPQTLTGDAGLAAAAWGREAASFDEMRPEEAALVIDAVFGIGLARPIDDAVAAAFARIDACGRPVLAVDIPSGIDALTGAVRGAAIRATRTLTFGALKPGHLLAPGRAYCGEVRVAEIGIPARTITDAGSGLRVNGPAIFGAALSPPRADGHKYDRGHALVMSGGPTHTGAARLAARAALRVGAGLVTLLSPARAIGVNAAHLTAVMLRACDDADELADLLTDDRLNALVLGPALGGGEPTRALVAAALEADRGTVLDADALTSFAGRLDELVAAIEPTREHAVVLTPHDGEFRRLFGAGEGGPAFADSASKIERARGAAALTGALVVLKGQDTVVAAPDGRAVLNTNGSAWLATAGTGDVLAGMVGGLLAQGVPGFEAACAAVWLHAEAARLFGPGLISEDLPETLPAVLRRLYGAG